MFILLLLFGAILIFEQLEKLVVENILAFDEVFWIRLATRSDTCKSDDDKASVFNCFSLFISIINQIFKLSLQKDYEELAATVMTIVDCVVNKTRVFFSFFSSFIFPLPSNFISSFVS